MSTSPSVPRAEPVRLPRHRRQFGSDTRKRPNPPVPPPASARALVFGRMALIVTIGSWAAYVVVVTGRRVFLDEAVSVRSTLEAVGYVVLVTFLMLSAVAYLIARQGYLRRTRSHVRTPRAELEAHFEHRRPTVTVLVPSYREQPEVILQTVLSAALQEFGQLRVVLLIDDPPAPKSPTDQDLLDDARALPGTVAAMLEGPRARFSIALDLASLMALDHADATVADLESLAADYEHAVQWIEGIVATWISHDHTDDFVVDHILRVLGHDLTVVAAAIGGAVLHRSTMSMDRVVQLQRRLATIFTAELGSFERKRYLNLSAEPNKAMNLNAYLGLMGRHFHEQVTSAGTLLLACDEDDPDASFHVPVSDFIVTLDADSVLLPEYILRLVYELDRPGSERHGVIQTPYSAFPGAPTRVERLAGATTDLQHIVHQGMAEHGAAFWVGANAVLRWRAVEDLRVDDDTEGHTVSRFISDRTVIEDTESTIDLVTKGWSVENYPERLAYSASPSDFGTLCIQRQRWSNGGLIILSKLVAQRRAAHERGEPRHAVELLLRLNYLASITWATLGLILLLVYPFDSSLMSTLVVAMSVPYFAVMATDLHRTGHKRTDVLRIYGFNLIMLPVNASGVLLSLGQLVTGHKVAFARTPKVRHRSSAPASFILSAYVIVAISAYALWRDIESQRWAHAVFAGANLLIAVPAIVAIIGIRNSIIDLWIGFANRLYSPGRSAPERPTLDPVVDWAAVLYHGSIEKPRGPHRRPDPRPAVPEQAS